MTSRERQEILREKLRGDFTKLEKAVASLRYSHDKSGAIIARARYSEEDFEVLDSLTSRFARVSDMYTQRVLTTVLQLLGEDAPSLIDRLNVCEKAGIIDSALEMKHIRDLRNRIAHEYLDEELRALVAEIMDAVPMLLVEIGITRIALEKRGYLS
jgi:uncharacterized protein with HEPN domain